MIKKISDHTIDLAMLTVFFPAMQPFYQFDIGKDIPKKYILSHLELWQPEQEDLVKGEWSLKDIFTEENNKKGILKKCLDIHHAFAIKEEVDPESFEYFFGDRDKKILFPGSIFSMISGVYQVPYLSCELNEKKRFPELKISWVNLNVEMNSTYCIARYRA